MKKPRFFCDNCGEEVDRDHNVCPRCGRFFASVRCPKCGFSGEDKLFANGCPSCGYSAVKTQGKGKKSTSFIKKKPEALPFWMYIVSFLAMLAVMALLLTVLLR